MAVKNSTSQNRTNMKIARISKQSEIYRKQLLFAEKKNLDMSIILTGVKDKLRKCKNDLKLAKTELKTRTKELRASEKLCNVRAVIITNLEKRLAFQRRLKLEAQRKMIKVPIVKDRKVAMKVVTNVCRSRRFKQIVDFLMKKFGKDEFEPFIKYFMRNVRGDDGSLLFTLSGKDSWYLKSKFKLSDLFLKNLKAFMTRKFGHDFLASRDVIAKLEKDNDITKYYVIKVVPVKVNGRSEESSFVYVHNLRALIHHRLTTLANAGKLRLNKNGCIEIVVCGDKGSGVTKLCICISNGTSPNSPYALTILGWYTGDDDYDNLDANLRSVFDLLNELETVTYSYGAVTVEKPVEFKLIGDHKFTSSVEAHQGQSAKLPCVKCDFSLITHGYYKMTLKKFDFKKKYTARKESDSDGRLKAGSHGMKKNGRRLLRRLQRKNIISPGVHNIAGLFKKFFVEPSTVSVNNNDCVLIKGSTLAQQKKVLMESRKIEDLYSARLERHKEYVKIVKKMEEYMKSYKNPRINKKCDAQFCFVDTLDHATEITWVECSTCSNYYHFICGIVISDEEKHRLTVEGADFQCLYCRVSGFDAVLDTIRFFINGFGEEVVELEKIHDFHKKKSDEIDGVLNQSMGPWKQKLEKFFKEIGCDRRTWFGDFIGSQIRKLLRKENIDKIIEILPKTEKSPFYKQSLYHLAEIMTLSGKHVLTDDDLKNLQENITGYTTQITLCHPEFNVTPKLHDLNNHVVEYAKDNETWGYYTEQSIEHLHVIWNQLNRTYASIPQEDFKARLILRKSHEYNHWYDLGEI